MHTVNQTIVLEGILGNIVIIRLIFILALFELVLDYTKFKNVDFHKFSLILESIYQFIDQSNFHLLFFQINTPFYRCWRVW